MKTIPLPKYALVETPQGADYHTCPLCEFWSNLFVGDCPEINKEEHYVNEDGIFCKTCNNGNAHFYCTNCNIIFDSCCVAKRKGCTDDIYYGLLISSFEENGVVQIGMPSFDSIDHAIKIYPTMNAKFLCYGNCQRSKT